MCYDTIDFPPYHLFQTLNPNSKPSLFPSRQFNPPMWEVLQGVEFVQVCALGIVKATTYLSQMQALSIMLCTYL